MLPYFVEFEIKINRSRIHTYLCAYIRIAYKYFSISTSMDISKFICMIQVISNLLLLNIYKWIILILALIEFIAVSILLVVPFFYMNSLRTSPIRMPHSPNVILIVLFMLRYRKPNYLLVECIVNSSQTRIHL